MDDTGEHLFDLNGLGFTSTIDTLFGSGGSADELNDDIDKANNDLNNESNSNKDLEQNFINDVRLHSTDLSVDMDGHKTELDLIPDIDMDEAFMININNGNVEEQTASSVGFQMPILEESKSICINTISSGYVEASGENYLQPETTCNDQINNVPQAPIVSNSESKANVDQLNKDTVNKESEAKDVPEVDKTAELNSQTVSTNKHVGESKSSSHRKKDDSSHSKKSKEHKSHKSSSRSKSWSKSEPSEKEKQSKSLQDKKDSKSDHGHSSSSTKRSNTKHKTVQQDTAQKPKMIPSETGSNNTQNASVEENASSQMESNVNSAQETGNTARNTQEKVELLKDDAKLKTFDTKPDQKTPEIPVDSNKTAVDENKQALDIEDELAKEVEISITMEIEKERTNVCSTVENMVKSASMKPETSSVNKKPLKSILKKQDSESSVSTGELLVPVVSSQKQDTSKKLSISEYKNRKRKEMVTDEMGSPPLKVAKTAQKEANEVVLIETNEIADKIVAGNSHQTDKAKAELADSIDLPSESKTKLDVIDDNAEEVTFEANKFYDRSRDNSETKSLSEMDDVKVKEETSDTGDLDYMYEDISDIDGEDDGDASDSDIMDDNEIYAMLEDGVEGKDKPRKKFTTSERERLNLKEGECITTVKYVLEEKNLDPFDVLPQGWIKVNHNCGMPIYLHRPTRTVTLTRPYFLGDSSLRGHAIPLSAIPCLQYKKAKVKEGSPTQDGNTTLTEEPQGEDATLATDQPKGTTADMDTDGTVPEADNKKQTTISDPPAVPKVDLLTSVDMQKTGVVETQEVHDYCKRLFTFNSLTVKKFKTWREKRSHLAQEAKKKRMVVPRLGEDSKLITCPLPVDEAAEPGKMKKKAFLLNPVGKTPLCILHEYAQNVLKTHPHYVFKEIENSENPFEASIIINSIHYASGIGQSKRQAKNNAAQNALYIFMPFMKDNLKIDRSKEDNFGYFESVPIEDPRVPELCEKAALNKPYQILADCLSRNHGLGNTNMQIDKKQISNQKTEFTLTVGKHKCSVIANNKREAKQQAAQAMLQKLHPSLTSWASILRMYSSAPKTSFAQAQAEPQESDTKKNFEILSNLKKAMLEMRQQRKQKDEQRKQDTASLAANAAVLNL